MSVDVMYQSYASYFPYQRPSAASPSGHGGDLFKKYGSMKQDPGLDAASSYSSHSSSSLTSLPSLPHTHAQHTHTGSSSAHLHHTPSSPLSAPAPSASSAAIVTKLEESHQHQGIGSPDLQQQQQQRQQQRQHHTQQLHSGDTHSNNKDSDNTVGGSCHTTAPTPHNAQYLSTNCVLFTYHAGDVASHVDEHFSRALSQPGSAAGSPTSPSSSGSFSTAADHPGGNAVNTQPKSPSSWANKGSSPMAQRNFPASFWNSNYHQSVSALSHPDPLGSLHSTSSDAYMTSQLHSMSSLGGDPWRYSLTSQPHSAPYSHSAAHHNVHDMASYAASISGTSRFQPHYGSLLGTSRLGGQCDLGKHSMDGHWGSRYHAESLGAPNLTGHHDATHHLHSAITAGGIESSMQEPSKDLYWF